MSDLSLHHTHTSDESHQYSFSFHNTEPRHGYHVPEWIHYLNPVHQSSNTSSSVRLESQRSVLPPNNSPSSPAVPLIHTYKSATVPFSPTSALPQTLRTASNPLYATGGSLPSCYSVSFGPYPLISEPVTRTVAMPKPIAQAQHSGNLIELDTPAHCYDPSSGFPGNHFTVENLRGDPSAFIAMPVAPTSRGADASSHKDPVLPSDPTFGSSRHPTTTFRCPLPSNSTLGPSPPTSFDSQSYSSLPRPVGNHAIVTSPPDMLRQTQLQPYVATSIVQPYTLTVPLEAVEFPPNFGSREVPFFQCCWGDCRAWITSEKEAVKYHLTHAHDVVLKGTSDDVAYCGWVDCSSSCQKTGLVRHFQTHLGLKWLCSVCNTRYTREDSVGFHARREPRCQLARAIGHPSTMAYDARVNGDHTVTLTKILQP